MKIQVCFNGLAPAESVTIGEQIIKNGAIVMEDERFLMPYIEQGIAFKVTTEADITEALKVQALTIKNEEKREKAQKGGDK